MGEGAPVPSGEWDLQETGDGSLTLRSPLHGEACHSRSGAWGEARERYARACRLPERLARGASLSVLEIGTGLGWNLAAALEAALGAGGRVELTSLELDPAVLRRALELGAQRLAGATAARSFIEPVLAALGRALEDGAGAPTPLGQGGSLRLVLGDARRSLAEMDPAARFDAVFLDAFSPGVEPELWTPEFLSAVAGRIAPGGLLSTYSAATRVRAGLRAAGLRVGPGPRFGAKAEGTLASPDLELEPFPPRVERRLERRAAAIQLELASQGSESASGGADPLARTGIPPRSAGGKGLD